MERGSTSQIRKIQIKTTVKDHYSLWQKSRTLTPANVSKDIEQLDSRSSDTDSGNAKWYNCLEDSLAVSYKAEHTQHIIQQSIILLGIHPKELKT